MKRPVSVLFARADSVYKTLCSDVWDVTRDALRWPGGNPIVAHPPCRSWGNFRKLSKHTLEEKFLAPWAVIQIHRWGGVLEHPEKSSLWKACGLPRPGAGRDIYGGFTLDVDQFWFGHRAKKRTWVYVCGCEPSAVPATPFSIERAPCVITNIHGIRKGHQKYRMEVTKREREATPPAFAEWLLALATRCRSRCIRKWGVKKESQTTPRGISLELRAEFRLCP